ncbi:MAG TPA: hypothetical protein VLT33_29895 [Labilithrix sp.]|nr:hypothetical protein [Labilithrix sp.]
MKQEHPTLDTRMVFRCMLVVREACRRMSEVLPLIVVLPGDGPIGELAELADLAGACGAEMVSVARPPDATSLGRQILDALRKGEARRVGR